MSNLNENMNNQLKQIEGNNNSDLTIKNIFKIFRYCDYIAINYVISNETKFDINMIYAHESLLSNACMEGHNEVVELLLTHKNIDVNFELPHTTSGG